jgi:hypothetical protein
LIALFVGIGLGSASSGSKTKTTTVTAPAQTVVQTVPGPTKTVPGPTKTLKVPGPTKTVTVPGPTKTVTVPSGGSSATPSTSAGVQTFHGVGTENIGTIHVPVESTLTWNCATCGGANFQIFNDASDAGMIPVNGLDQTSGKTVIDAGDYHSVQINTEGQDWSLTITPGNSTN